MTRIDFYQLPEQGRSEDQVVSLLLRKIHAQGLSALLLARDIGHSQHLDDWLWRFDEESFLPHGQTQELGRQPIWIQYDCSNSDERDVLINLQPQVPAYFTQFERVVELVTAQNKESARDHFRFYKERGYPLDHHTL